ncbi:MAG TPA: hypothetical protein VJV23_11220 [Candidatus Polarisedimenticolia bacterium]|nr:hypothetical protein [Candidatus Polarisedimenticolia bacterium]
MPHARKPRTPGAILAAGLAPLVLLAISGRADATTLRKMDLPELVSLADRVVHARVLDQTVYWNESRTQIHTDTTFEVLDQAKGDGPATLTVTLFGGRIDPLEMREEGTPIFETGEEVVLFASLRPDGKNNLAGFSQGVMRVEVEEASGVKFAMSEVPVGVDFVEASGTLLVPVRPSPLRARLSSLLDEVRRMTTGQTVPGPAWSPVAETPATVEEGQNP